MIRKAKRKDIDAIIELCTAHARYEQSSYSSNNKAEQLFSALFAPSPRLFCFVAEENGLIVGYTTYSFQYSTWEAAEYIFMDCLFIREGFRCNNLGEKMVLKIVNEGKKQNCFLMQWHTPNFNEGAIRFYNRLGAHSKSKERFYLSI